MKIPEELLRAVDVLDQNAAAFAQKTEEIFHRPCTIPALLDRALSHFFAAADCIRFCGWLLAKHRPDDLNTCLSKLRQADQEYRLAVHAMSLAFDRDPHLKTGCRTILEECVAVHDNLAEVIRLLEHQVDLYSFISRFSQNLI